MPRAYRQRGLTHNALGQMEKAIQDFNQAQKLNPKDPEVYYSRGMAHRRLGKNDQAVADYTEAIKLDPKNAEPITTGPTRTPCSVNTTRR